MFENNWASLNMRKVPQWFADAKFGIFIHWGLYSVPAYAPKGSYAEWYGYWCNRDDLTGTEKCYSDFHKKHYGGRDYFEFKNDFKGDRFDAEKWAELFKRSGAKYINFVSKHHDGYCLYETQYAPNHNSVECLPKRDFLMELKNAMEGTGVKFGVYHSVYEWFHPLYLKNPEEYSVEHLLPMLKELVEKYRPWTLFTDGEWEHESSVWHSEDFLQWLYNESSVKDTIAVNDRWGKETRGRVGGFFTTEYGIIDNGRKIEDVELDRPFEECRGIGASFGINKEEGAEDYLTVNELIKTLVSLVSKGGNFQLNIGPDADGTIPPIMEERLLGIGEWLDTNGDAIYGTSVYSAKAPQGVYYTKKDGAVFAMTESFPSKKTVFPEIAYKDTLKAELLGSSSAVEIINESGSLALKTAIDDPSDVDSKYVYVYKITE